METNKNNAKATELNKNPIELSKILGYLLLIPPVISVILFIVQLFSDSHDLETLKNFKYGSWTGDWAANSSGGGGFMSALPLYFGLMAIAGAYLVRNRPLK